MDRATRPGKWASSDTHQLAVGSAVEDRAWARPAAARERLRPGCGRETPCAGTDQRTGWNFVKLMRTRELEELPQPLHRLPQLGTPQPDALGDGC